MIVALAFVIGGQRLKPPPIPVGSPIAKIGKILPGRYQANRAMHTLPRPSSLSASRRKTFSGLIWKEGVVERPAEFVRGKRVMMRTMGPYGGQTVDAYLKMVGPKVGLRYSTKELTGFVVALPGDEKKLTNFEGRLATPVLSIGIKNGKVTDASYSNAK